MTGNCQRRSVKGVAGKMGMQRGGRAHQALDAQLCRGDEGPVGVLQGGLRLRALVQQRNELLDARRVQRQETLHNTPDISWALPCHERVCLCMQMIGTGQRRDGEKTS